MSEEQEREPLAQAEQAQDVAAAADSPATLAPPPAPLRTASALSTTSSSATLLVSTPLASPPAAARAPSPSSRPRSPSPSADAPSPSHDADAEPVALARDEKLLVPVCTFAAIEVWNPDWPVPGARVDEEDDVGRTVAEWVGVASKVRASLSLLSLSLARGGHEERALTRLRRSQIHAY